MGTGPWFKVSSERLEKPGIDLPTSGLVVVKFNPCPLNGALKVHCGLIYPYQIVVSQTLWNN